MKYIIISLILLLFFLTIIKPKSKFLTICMMGIFVIMIAGTYDSYDYNQYCIMYSRAASNLTNTVSGTWLLSVLMKLGSTLGLSYDGFRLVITIIESLVIQSTIKRYCKSTALVWAVFILYPGWWLTTLFRHTIALTIMIFSIRYLVEDKRLNWIKYLVCVTLAGTFHSAFWFFILLILIQFVNEKFIVMVGAGSIVTFFVSSQIPVVNNLFRILRVEDDIVARFNGMSMSINGLTRTILDNLPFLLPGIIIKWIDEGKLRLGSKRNQLYHEGYAVLMKSHNRILATFLLFLCVSLVSSIAARLSHFYSFYFILVAAGTMEKHRVGMSKRIFFRGLVYFVSFLLTVIVCLQSNSLFELIIKAIFETNVILNF